MSRVPRVGIRLFCCFFNNYYSLLTTYLFLLYTLSNYSPVHRTLVISQNCLNKEVRHLIATIDTELVRIARTMLAYQNGAGMTANNFWTALQREYSGVPQSVEEREQLLSEIGAVVAVDEFDEDSVPVIRIGS